MFIHSANSDRKRSIGYASVECQELNVPLLIGKHGPIPCFIEPKSRYVMELVPQNRQSPCGWTPQVGDGRTPGRRAAFMSEGRGGRPEAGCVPRTSLLQPDTDDEQLLDGSDSPATASTQAP